jgi:hypothetical protein
MCSRTHQFFSVRTLHHTCYNDHCDLAESVIVIQNNSKAANTPWLCILGLYVHPAKVYKVGKTERPSLTDEDY